MASQISSPADPALLFFKLNKLQQSQNASTTNSLSTSPQPPVNLSPSPNQLPPRLQQNRHGHSISLAQPSSHSPLYNPSGAFNPFGPTATLGSDQVLPRTSPRPVVASSDTCLTRSRPARSIQPLSRTSFLRRTCQAFSMSRTMSATVN